jgi:hypothetical protein
MRLFEYFFGELSRITAHGTLKNVSNECSTCRLSEFRAGEKDLPPQRNLRRILWWPCDCFSFKAIKYISLYPRLRLNTWEIPDYRILTPASSV